MLIPIIGKKLYSTEKPVSKNINAIMIIARIMLFILLITGIVLTFSYLKNIDPPF